MGLGLEEFSVAAGVLGPGVGAVEEGLVLGWCFSIFVGLLRFPCAASATRLYSTNRNPLSNKINDAG